MLNKKYALSLVAAVVAAAGALAMNSHKQNSQQLDTYYYEYQPNATDLASYQNADNWIQISSPSESNCTGGDAPCVVYSDQENVENFVQSIQSTSDVDSRTLATKPAM